MIAHIVLFTPKRGMTDQQLRLFAQTALDTCSTIPTISKAMIGRSIRVDPGYHRLMGDTTYQFAAVLEFSDTAGLLDYLRHPKHEVLGRLFWESCEAVTVVEVEGRSPDNWNLSEFLEATLATER